MEFFSAELEADGLDPPATRPPARDRAGTPGMVWGGIRSACLTAKGAHHFLNSEIRPRRARRPGRGRTRLDIRPADADARGIVDGQAVRVFNDRGSLTLACSRR